MYINCELVRELEDTTERTSEIFWEIIEIFWEIIEIFWEIIEIFWRISGRVF
jgi:hypothetical protein